MEAQSEGKSRCFGTEWTSHEFGSAAVRDEGQTLRTWASWEEKQSARGVFHYQTALVRNLRNTSVTLGSGGSRARVWVARGPRGATMAKLL